MLFLVYIAWGSSYIGNKLSLEVAGPFLVCGVRNMLGGLLLGLAVALWQRRWLCPTPAEVARHAVMAIVLVVMTGGFIVWGQTQVTSAVAAVLASIVPVLMILGGWLFAGEPRPNTAQWLGMVTGGAGVILLAWSQQSAGTSTLTGIALELVAAVAWVAGSLIMKKYPLGERLPMLESTSLLLFCGGFEAFVLGLVLGEPQAMHWENLRPGIVVAFAWMVVGGSVIAYACYLWLLKNVSTPVAISYEYVTPVIALFLGAIIGREDISPAMLLACALTILSVFFVIRHRHGIRVYVRHYLVRKYQYREDGLRQ